MRNKRKWQHRLLAFILSICLFIPTFMSAGIEANASVYNGGSMGSGTGTSGYIGITATGSWYADRYSFTPSRTGVWRFYSANKSKGDPYIIISDANNESRVKAAINSAKCKSTGNGEFASNDDGNGNLNFNVYVFLEKGKTYYIFNSRYSTSDTVYTTYYSYMGAGTVTLNPQGGTGGTTKLYGGRSGYSPSKSSYDKWFATSTTSPAVSEITIPTRAGYAFEGYYTGTNGTGTRIIDSNGKISDVTLKNTFSSNGTLYAKWRALTSTYQLDPNGGADGQESVVVNQYAILPTLSALPSRTGYEFNGFYTSDTVQDSTTVVYRADGTTTYENKLAGQTITLYAGWKAKTYSAILNANGGTGGSSVDMVYDAALTSGLSAPAKTGYVFNGYYYDYGKDSQVQYYNSLMQAQRDEQDNILTWKHAFDGVQLVADWTPIKYDIQLFSNDDVYGVGPEGRKTSGYVSTIEDVVYGDMLLPSAQELGLSREHYDFVGWNIYDEQDWAMFYPYTQYNTGLASSEGESTQLYAAWKMKDNYTISYNINGGDGNYPRNQTIFKGDTLTITDTIPTYENHTFIGWYLTPNGQSEASYEPGDEVSNITENTTFYARWKENKTISYNANGGVFSTEFVTQYYPDSDEPVKVYLPGAENPKGFDRTLTEADMPVRVGYDFKGWAKTADATVPDYAQGETETLSMRGVAQDIILYAVWEVKEYDITHSVEGTESSEEVLVTVGNLPEKVKHGQSYQFNVSVDDRSVDVTGLMVTVNDVVITHSEEVTDGNTHTYTFEVGSAISGQNVVVAGATPKEYEVNYVLNGGVFNDDTVTRSYNYSSDVNDTVTLSNTLSKTGYTFAGWYESADFGASEITAFAKSDAADKTFHAKWTPNTYTIIYDKNGDYVSVNNPEVLEAQSCLYDNNVELASPSDADWTCKIGEYQFDFAGWSTSENATVAEYLPGEVVRNLDTESGAEVTLYAVWDIPSYIVSYDTNGAENAANSTATLYKGMNVTFPENPTRTGYTFRGWKDSDSETGSVVDSIAGIDRDYDLVAQWEVNKYSVVYKVKVPSDGKLLTDTGSEVSAGTQVVDGVEYKVEVDADGAYIIKSDTNIGYDEEYTFAEMPFTMKSKYNEFVLKDTEFKAYLDKVALYYAWRAYDALDPLWNQEIPAEGEGTEATPAGWYDDFDSATAAWQQQLAAACSGLVQEQYKDYVSEKYADYIKQPFVQDTEAPDAPGPDDSRAGELPTAKAEPDVVAEPAERAKTVFKGWNTDADAEDALYVAGGTYTNICTGNDGDDSKTFYAIFGDSGENYLFYNVNGGIWPAGGALTPQRADNGTNATVATQNSPSKVGYTFDGWSLDGNSAVTTVDLASGHQTVKAIWIPDTYKVYFDRNDTGSYVNSMEDENGNTVENYYTGSVNVVTVVGDDITYDEKDPQVMTYGTETELVANNYRSENNYDFLGWSLREDATRPDYKDGQSVKNLPYVTENGEKAVRLYAVWQKKDAFIRFNANGGSGEPSAIYRQGNETEFALLTGESAPVLDGYSFEGWSNSPDAATAEYKATVEDGVITAYAPASISTASKAVLYAVWKETPYVKVVYVKADGTAGAVPVDNTKYYAGNEVTVDFSKLPTKPGYHFDGWARTEDTVYRFDAENQVSFAISANDMADGETENVITLTEKLAANTYTAEFYFRGNLIGTKKLTYDAQQAPEVDDIMGALETALGADSENYTYQGWSLTDGGSVSYSNEQLRNLTVINNGTVKLYAVMKAKQVSIAFDNQNNSETETKTATYGEVLPAVTAIPVKEGYTFAGYYAVPNPGSADVAVYDATLNTTGVCSFNVDTTLFAKWTPKTYKVMYVYEGNILYTDTLTYKESARETTVASQNIFPTGVIVQGATALYGWSENGQNEGDVYRVGADYKYDFWEIAGGNDLILYPIIVPDEKVTITYNANGGVGIPVDTTEYQAGDIAPVMFNKIPKMENHEFLGWSIDPSIDVSRVTEDNSGNFFPYEKDGANDYEIVTHKNMTLYAIWKVGTYDITYKTNTEDATLVEGAAGVLTVERGSTLSNHAGKIYERPGYELQGWSASRNMNNAVMYDLDAPIENTLTTRDNIDLYTVWSAADVLVVFDTVGGNALSATTVKYDSAYGILPAPEKEGFTFEGWYTGYDEDTNEYTGPITSTSVVSEAERHVLYAKWTEDTFEINYHLNYADNQVITKVQAVGQDIILLNENEIVREGHDLLGYAISESGPIVYEVGQAVGTVWATKDAVINLYCIWDVETGVEVEKTQSYIYYVSNGAGNGLAPAHDVYTNNSKATIRDNEGNMSKYGYYFAGWNTEPDGSGTAYMPGDEIAINQSMILFADWRINSYSLLTNMDSGIKELTVSPQKELYTYGDQVSVTATLKEGYKWNGFVSDREEDVPGSLGEVQTDGSYVYSFKMGGAVVGITAQSKVDVTFNPNGGVFAEDYTEKVYECVTDSVFDTTVAEIPERGAGYTFIGWFADPDCTQPWDAQTIISVPVTLYAGWGYSANDGEMCVSTIQDQIYTGSKLKPSVVVRDGDKILKQGVDYTITYKNNKNVNKGRQFVQNNALEITADSIDAKNINIELPYIKIVGKGNYSGQILMNFNILPKSISNVDNDAEWNLYYEPYVTGTTKGGSAPAMILKYMPQQGNAIGLKADKDYIVTYSGAAGEDLRRIPAGASGTYTMKVSANENGQYTGVFTKEIQIINENQNLANAKVVIKKMVLKKDMTADDLNITVKMGKTTLKKGVDFAAEFVDGSPENAGTYMVRIKPAEGSSYTGEAIGKATLSKASFAKARINVISDAMYTGENYKDGIVSIMDNGVELERGVDYTTSYTGGVNAGKVTVTINGLGIYKGSTQKTSYNIAKYNLSKDVLNILSVLSPSQPAEYSKDGAKVNPSVMFGTTELIQGADYNVQFTNNKQLTTAYSVTRPQVIISGKGNFSGKISGGYFDIVQRTFTQENMKAVASDVNYKENGLLNVKFTLYEANSQKALVAGVDYDKATITYTCNGEVITKCPDMGSEVMVSVKGINNYKGTYTFPVKVGNVKLSKARWSPVTKVYTGNEITLTEDEITLTYKIANASQAAYFNQAGTYVKKGQTEICTTLKAKDTIILEAGRDYDFDSAVYSNNISRGTATVTLRAKGIFKGSKTLTFKIQNKSLKWWETLF